MSVGYVCSSSRSHVSAAIYACWKTYAATVAMDNAIKCKLRSLEILVNVGVAIFTAKRRTTPGEHEPCGAPRIAAMDTWPLTPLLNELLDEIFPEESDCSVDNRNESIGSQLSNRIDEGGRTMERASKDDTLSANGSNQNITGSNATHDDNVSPASLSYSPIPFDWAQELADPLSASPNTSNEEEAESNAGLDDDATSSNDSENKETEAYSSTSSDDDSSNASLNYSIISSEEEKNDSQNHCNAYSSSQSTNVSNNDENMAIIPQHETNLPRSPPRRPAAATSPEKSSVKEFCNISSDSEATIGSPIYISSDEDGIFQTRSISARLPFFGFTSSDL